MPSPVPFRKVRKLLENAGWRLERIHGSHHTFTKKGRRNFVVPVHGNEVRWVYVRQIEKEIDNAKREQQ